MIPHSEGDAQQPAGPQADPFFVTVRELFRAETRPDWSNLILLLVIVFVSGTGLMGAVAFIAALGMRDLVRLATMKLVNAFDARLLTFPLVRGELPIGTTPGREAVIILSGPAFLVALSVVTFFLSKITGPGIVQELSRSSVGLAAFTLLPLKPYDGWRLLNLALFSRSAKVEMVVAVLTSLLLAGAAIALQWWMMTLFAAINVFTSTRVLKIDAAAKRLTAPISPDVTDESVVRKLYDATVAVFDKTLTPRDVPQARMCAGLMKEVHLRAARPLPSLGVSVLLVTVYGALVIYFVIGLLLLISAASPGPTT